MANGISLQTRPLKLEIQDIQDLNLPCILHWDMSHFVVLKQFKRARAIIHDPRVGIRTLSPLEFANHFTGIALELIPSSQFQRKEEVPKFSLLSLLGRVVGLKRGLFQIFLLALVLQVCALVTPFYMQWLVDEALLAGDRDLITVLGCGFLLLVLVQSIISAARAWITTVLSTNLNLQWLGNAFTHLLRLPMDYFEKRHTGDIVSRFSSIQTIQNALTSQFVESIIDGILVLSTLALMLLYSATLTLVTIVFLLLYLALRTTLYQPTRNATSEQIVHCATQQTHFMETMRCIQSIRLYNHSEHRRSRWLNALANQFNAELRIARLSLSYDTASSMLFGAERIIVVWLAGLAVLDSRFTVGMLFAFVSYKDQFSQRAACLVDRYFEWRMLRLHGDRVADIVLTEPEINGDVNEIASHTITPSIELRNVKFRYADGEPLILSGIDLFISAGECIGITGSSGSGKTTLIKIILGLLEPSEGEVLIGGVNIKHLGLSNYRQMIGTVMQDDSLLVGSVADNISFFDPTPDENRIQTCAMAAAIHSEISEMPMGFNTLVGDIGTGLSGGQRQRVLLARALYRHPKILVLDEATSHMDVLNEQTVNLAIKNLHLTRIVVAHRPETIATTQRVVVVHRGSIIQEILHGPRHVTEGAA